MQGHGVFTFLVELHGDASKLTPKALEEILTYGLICYAGRHRDTELLGQVDSRIGVIELARWDLTGTPAAPESRPLVSIPRSA
jgi:hypothetical protein